MKALMSGLIFLLLIGSAFADNEVEYTLNGDHLICTVRGTGSRSLAIYGSKSAGGSVSVTGQSPDYTFGANAVVDITVVVYWEDRPYCNGLNVNYVDHATIADNNAFKFHVYGCSGANSSDVICTGGAADYVNAYGGLNAIATGHGNDFIETEGDSYVFTGQGGIPWGPPYWGDSVYWDGTIVIYTADDTQAIQWGQDYISPNGYWIEELTVHDTGPLTGWN